MNLFWGLGIPSHFDNVSLTIKPHLRKSVIYLLSLMAKGDADEQEQRKDFEQQHLPLLQPL